MLVLTRKLQEKIQIGDNVTITILRVKGNTVRVGIEAPRDLKVVRGELPPLTEVEITAEDDSLVADDSTEDSAAEGKVVSAARVSARSAKPGRNDRPLARFAAPALRKLTSSPAPVLSPALAK